MIGKPASVARPAQGCVLDADPPTRARRRGLPRLAARLARFPARVSPPVGAATGTRFASVSSISDASAARAMR
jgi:hypothetical protein